jgi:hypothetical protein
MMDQPIQILSLGWGVQSFTLAAMIALGELEPIDFCLHADTTHESILTYRFIQRWSSWLEEHQVIVHTVTNPKRNGDVNAQKVDIPGYTLNVKGELGQINRQCTFHWKIVPMRHAIRNYLASIGMTNPKPGAVMQLIGISLDEFQRMHDSDVQYITHRWPLIEKHMTRKDCVTWLIAHGLEVPPKSACTFCPYHDGAAWHEMWARGGPDWAEAVRVDREIRKTRPPHDLFVHPARKPLEEIDLRTLEEMGQLSLWDNECSGVCGV